MKFCLLYRNIPEARETAVNEVIAAIKQGISFEQSPIRTPIFHSLPQWPSTRVLVNLPLWLQCEEVEYKDDKLTTTRRLVNDIETEVVKDNSPPTIS
jgi:hypothetical protein